jgi:hypothetical protein
VLDCSHVSGSKKEPSPASEKRGPRPWRARSGSFFCGPGMACKAATGAGPPEVTAEREVTWG